MNLYHVTGTITDTWYCECEFCPGHDWHTSVNDTIAAETENDAADEAYRSAIIDQGNGNWVDGPNIQQKSEAELMVYMGAFPLPSFESSSDRVRLAHGYNQEVTL